MNARLFCFRFLFVLAGMVISFSGSAQLYDRMSWSRDGNKFYISEEGAIVEFSLEDRSRQILVSPQRLIPAGNKNGLDIKNFFFSYDFKKVLIYTNAKKVWRYETRGDYWVYNFADSSLTQLGKSFPASSLMFAKFSPDGNKAAYVSGHNIYAEDLHTHLTEALT